jgi:crotonobetainyl-CoA:carnitine CoA-transferase CaiB-like acyl-CoA transferase
MAAPRKQYQPCAAGPLNGVRVLDLGRFVSGGHLSTVLADLGADVVKVEQPGLGDGLRAALVNGYDAYWQEYSRSKRSITLNLKHPRGRALLLDLLERADVLTENFTPGTLEQLGLGPEVLLARNPRLVIARISGWGQTGPYAHRPGFGTLAEGFAGFTQLNGYADRPPLPPPFSLADMTAGLYASAAVVAALYHCAANGGAGQVIDVSLFEPLFSMLGPDAATTQAGRIRQRGEGTRASSVKGAFQTADDKWVVLSAASPEVMVRFFRAIGHLELLEDPRFATYSARLDHQQELNDILAEFFHTHTRREVLDFSREHDLTIGPVYDIADALDDEHFAARETIVEMVADVTALDAPGVLMHNVVPRLSATPGAIRWPAPALGEHNQEVFGELGIAPEGLIGLAEAGVI